MFHRKIWLNKIWIVFNLMILVSVRFFLSAEPLASSHLLDSTEIIRELRQAKTGDLNLCESLADDRRF